MIVGIQHRDVQTCPRCSQIFMWTPAIGLCPYCDLSQRARNPDKYSQGEPCPTDCCNNDRERTSA